MRVAADRAIRSRWRPRRGPPALSSSRSARLPEPRPQNRSRPDPRRPGHCSLRHDFGYRFWAAGESRRMGSPKALLPYRGRTFIANICDAFLTGGVAELVVVLGAHEHAEPIRAALPAHPALRVVTNARYRLGQLSSLMAGIQALSPDSEAAVVNLVDHPLVRSETIPGAMRRVRTRSGADRHCQLPGPARASGPVSQPGVRRDSRSAASTGAPRRSSAKTRPACAKSRSTILASAPISTRPKRTPVGSAPRRRIRVEREDPHPNPLPVVPELVEGGRGGGRP